MIHHLGRLIDHIHLRVADLETSRRFYRMVLETLGRTEFHEDPDFFSADELWIDRADEQSSKVHLAFQAPDRQAVMRFYEAALAAGGRDNGAPGERHYHPGYFAAYVLDPDDNNIEAVWHGPAMRFAASVEVHARDT